MIKADIFALFLMTVTAIFFGVCVGYQLRHRKELTTKRFLSVKVYNEELLRAEKPGARFGNLHEAYAVILEELDENGC